MHSSEDAAAAVSEKMSTVSGRTLLCTKSQVWMKLMAWASCRAVYRILVKLLPPLCRRRCCRLVGSPRWAGIRNIMLIDPSFDEHGDAA